MVKHIVGGIPYEVPVDTDLADIPAAFRAFAESIPKFPAFPSLSGYALKAHTHAYAPASHTHPHSQISGFEQHSDGGSFREVPGIGSKPFRKSSFFTVASLVFTLKPGTWTVVVEADGQLATLRSGSTQISSKIIINGKPSLANLSPSIQTGGHFQPITSHAVTGLSGKVTIAVQYSMSDPRAGVALPSSTEFGALRFVEATWQAFRTG